MEWAGDTRRVWLKSRIPQNNYMISRLHQRCSPKPVAQFEPKTSLQCFVVCLLLSFRWRASQNVLRNSREIIALVKQVAVAHDWTSKPPWSQNLKPNWLQKRSYLKYLDLMSPLWFHDRPGHATILHIAMHTFWNVWTSSNRPNWYRHLTFSFIHVRRHLLALPHLPVSGPFPRTSNPGDRSTHPWHSGTPWCLPLGLMRTSPTPQWRCWKALWSRKRHSSGNLQSAFYLTMSKRRRWTPASWRTKWRTLHPASWAVQHLSWCCKPKVKGGSEKSRPTPWRNTAFRRWRLTAIASKHLI